MGWSWALAYFTVLSLRSIILLMMLSHTVALLNLHVAQFLLPAFPSLWMFFGKYMSISPLRNGAWRLPLTGLSWLPSRFAWGSLLFHQAPSPHLHVCFVNGFNLQILSLSLQQQSKQMQINLKKEPMASALTWRKSSNNWQWRPVHWEHEHLYSK